jgi:hypothetical protein
MAADKTLILSDSILEGGVLQAALNCCGIPLKAASVVASSTLPKLSQGIYSTVVSVSQTPSYHNVALLGQLCSAMRPGGKLIVQEAKVRTQASLVWGDITAQAVLPNLQDLLKQRCGLMMPCCVFIQGATPLDRSLLLAGFTDIGESADSILPAELGTLVTVISCTIVTTLTMHVCALPHMCDADSLLV